GRKVGRVRAGIPLHLYLPGPHRGVFNVEALRESKAVILCEALIDAVTFWCAGYKNVTASYGVEGFTAEYLEAFKRHGTERVLLAYDRDDPGERAAAALAEKLIGEGIECFRIGFPRGMDANEYALKVTPAEKSLGVLIRNASWLGRGPSELAGGEKKLFSWRRSSRAALAKDREEPASAASVKAAAIETALAEALPATSLRVEEPPAAGDPSHAPAPSL